MITQIDNVNPDISVSNIEKTLSSSFVRTPNYLDLLTKACMFTTVLTTTYNNNPTIKVNYNLISDTSIVGSAYNHINKLKEFFKIVNPDETNNYLQNNLEVVNSLINCIPELYRYFQTQNLSLELHRDAENSDWITLFVSIEHHLEIEDLYSRFDDFVENFIVFQTPEFRKSVTFSI